MPSRRPAPTILLTAVAATLVVVPWASNGMPGPDRGTRADAAETTLSSQPLAGVGGGETIREITRPTTFSLVAITGSDLTGTAARIRARKSDGSWGTWYRAERSVDISDGSGSASRGTDPVYVGPTTAVQIALTRPAHAPVTTAPPETGVDAGLNLGYRPVNTSEPLSQNLAAVFITPPRAPVEKPWIPPAAAPLGPGQPPRVISRAEWGAGNGGRCGGPTYGPGVRAAVVHHTATGNDYSPEDSFSILRAIYTFHTVTLGWCDIAYNALVDKYGQVFEGRAGGITKDVTGSHTGGFNTDVWGVSMIGDFESTPPPDVMVNTVGRLLGWRLSLDRVNPGATVNLMSGGGQYTVVPGGQMVQLPEIFAHRDVGNTECPGAAGYAVLDRIRSVATAFTRPPEVIDTLRGGAILSRWEADGGEQGALGKPTSPEAAADGAVRYATFEHGAMYWSPNTGAQPLTGALYTAWATLGFERGALGLPTSGEIAEPQWIVQNFQHGTLNYDRHTHNVVRVIDGVSLVLPPPQLSEPPTQLERFSPIAPAGS